MLEANPNSAPSATVAGLSPSPTSRPAAVRHNLSFHGDGPSLFGLMLVNGILTGLTLGIYSPWARTQMRQYLIGHTDLDGSRFAYHGTGGELFRGLMKVIGLVFAAGIMLGVINGSFGAASMVTKLMTLMVYLVGLSLMPYAIVGARRYLLSRISWRDHRFAFHGDSNAFVGLFFKNLLLTVLTLGFYSPIAFSNSYSFFVNGTSFGGREFAYDGKGRDLLGSYVKAFLLSFVTLGLYWFWFVAEQERYTIGHTRFGRARFQSSMEGGALLTLGLTNLLLIVFTFGLGFAWVVARSQRYMFGTLSLVGPLDVESLHSSPLDGSNSGDRMADAFENDLGAGLSV